MKKEFIKLSGKKDGPQSIILAGVHGNEKCGIEAFKDLIPNLKIERGIVWFGYGNPIAIKKDVRFNEADLNRVFKNDKLLTPKERKSYEYSRAQIIKEYLDQSDALLDIHANRTPKSNPFIICEPNSRKITAYLPAKLIVSGFDNLEPGGTDYYMNNNGKMGICIECGFIDDPKSIQIAKDGILAFLKARGHIKNNLFPKKQTSMQVGYIYITKVDFAMSKQFTNFEKVSKGQLIGKDGGKEIRARKDGFVLFVRNKTKAGEEAFLFGKINKK